METFSLPDTAVFEEELLKLENAIEQNDKLLCKQIQNSQLQLLKNFSLFTWNVLHVAKDELGSALMPEDLPMPNYVVAKSTGNGNCFFNAVSISLIGNESLTNCLRLLAASELFLMAEQLWHHQAFQKAADLSGLPKNVLFRASIGSQVAADFYAQTSNSSGALKQEAKIASKSGSYSGLVSLFALANALSMNIYSVYPKLYNRQNQGMRFLFNQLIQPIVPVSNKIHIAVLWSRDGNLDNSSGEYSPNHFVPVLEIPTRKRTISAGTEDEILTRVNSRGHVRPKEYKKGTRQKEYQLFHKESVTSGTSVEFQGSQEFNRGTLFEDQAGSQDEIIDNPNDISTEILQSEPDDFESSSDDSADDDDSVDWYDKLFNLHDDLFNEANNDSGIENTFVSSDSSLTVKQSVLLIWLYYLVHNLSKVQLTDLLHLMSLHFNNPPEVYQSLHHFKKFLCLTDSHVKKHKCCKFCTMPVDKNTSVCPNTLCCKDLTKEGSTKYFIEIPVEKQLQNLFSHDSFVEQIQKRFNREKINDSNIEDIYDGEIYKQLSCDGGPLSQDHPFNISFTLNTDGVNIFKSSKMSVWPVYLMINELPHKLRKHSSNMILAGLWYGDEKPDMHNFTKPLHNSLKKLEKTGIELQLAGKVETCKAYLLCWTTDLPARSCLLNMNQFNGEYSCVFCLQKGANFRTDNGGNIRVFPYDRNEPFGPERTKSSIEAHAKVAFDEKKANHGIKGPSFLMDFKHLHYAMASGMDYMHCVFLGISRLLIGLWFLPANAREAFSLSNYIHTVDSQLVNIKPTCTITRSPRSISQHFKYWKASELRSWLLYYSIPLLVNLMNPVYFYHHCCLVEAIFMLSKESISSDEIKYCEKLLCYYVFIFKDLYGERYITLNVHSLLHLPKVVKNLGPLWANSCFPFENANGELLKLFHGTQYVDLQMVNAVNVLQQVPLMIKPLPANSNVLNFIKKLKPSFVPGSGSFETSAQARVIGMAHHRELSTDLLHKLGTFVENLLDPLFFKRVIFKGFTYQSKAYSKVKVRNSYTVKYLTRNNVVEFASIEWYVQVDNQIFAYVEKFKLCDKSVVTMGAESIANIYALQLKHIHPVEKRLLGHDFVAVHDFISLGIFIEGSETNFICEEPNYKEIAL